MVLSHSLFHWHGCAIPYSWFSKPKYSLFIVFIYLIPSFVIHYSASTPKPLDLMSSLIKFTLTDTRIENVNETVPTSNLLAVTHWSINYHYPLCNSKYKKKPSDSNKILWAALLNPNAPLYQKTDKIQITTVKRLRRLRSHPIGSFTSYDGCFNLWKRHIETELQLR